MEKRDPIGLLHLRSTILDCFTNEIWKDLRDKIWPDFEMSEGLEYLDVPYGDPEAISDATWLFSFIAIRKLDDFLSSGKKKPDDLNWADFDLNRELILSGRSEFLPLAARRLIRKAIVHLTERGDLEVEEMELLQDIRSELRPSLEIFARQIDNCLGLGPDAWPIPGQRVSN